MIDEHSSAPHLLFPIQSSEDEDFGASVADDDDEDEDAGSDIGSVDSRAHSRQAVRGACRRKAIRTQRKARKWQRGRRRCSSEEEEEEEDSEEEMGKCQWGRSYVRGWATVSSQWAELQPRLSGRSYGPTLVECSFLCLRLVQ